MRLQTGEASSPLAALLKTIRAPLAHEALRSSTTVVHTQHHAASSALTLICNIITRAHSRTNTVTSAHDLCEDQPSSESAFSDMHRHDRHLLPPYNAMTA